MKKSDDPRRTSRFNLFENHYANLEDELRWNTDRVHRLCAALQLTEFELGAMIRMKIPEMVRSLRANQFSASAELHLTLLERAVFPNSKPSLFPQ
jgi:hypothetical protein